jgi:hypothetical protein
MGDHLARGANSVTTLALCAIAFLYLMGYSLIAMTPRDDD